MITGSVTEVIGCWSVRVGSDDVELQWPWKAGHEGSNISFGSPLLRSYGLTENDRTWHGNTGGGETCFRGSATPPLPRGLRGPSVPHNGAYSMRYDNQILHHGEMKLDEMKMCARSTANADTRYVSGSSSSCCSHAIWSVLVVMWRPPALVPRYLVRHFPVLHLAFY